MSLPGEQPRRGPRNLSDGETRADAGVPRQYMTDSSVPSFR